MTKLTIANAKEYVEGYYAALEGYECDIEGAGIINSFHGGEAHHMDVVCRLNVTTTHEGERDAVQWDVWLEDDGMGGLCLYGEF